MHGGQEGFSPTAGFRHCHRHCYHSVRLHWTRYTTKNSDTLRMTLNGFSFSSAELFLQMVPLCQWDQREIFHAPKHCVEGTCGRRSVRAEAPTSLRSSTLPAPTRSSATTPVPFSSLSLLHVAESLFYSYGPANLFHLKNRKSITLSFVVTESTYIQSFAIVLSPLIQLRIHTIKIEFFLNSPSFDIFLLFHPLTSPINSIIMCSCLQ